jgi:hypothetical protein
VLAWDLGRHEGPPRAIATIYVGGRHDSPRNWDPLEWRWMLSGAYEPHRIRVVEGI